MDFVVTVDNNVDIQYEILHTDIANKWYDLFCKTVKTISVFRENEKKYVSQRQIK